MVYDMKVRYSILKNGSVLLTPAFNIVISKQLFSSVEEIFAFFDAAALSIDRIQENLWGIVILLL